MTRSSYLPIIVLWVSFITITSTITASGVRAEGRPAPYGTAETVDVGYPPAKVLYDVFSGDAAKLSNILDRVSALQNLYGSDPFDASIVLIIHGDAIPAFAIRNLDKFENLMRRAKSLTASDVIEFRMCGASAKIKGYEARDIHGFISMVPMADAEIIRLQNAGYVYMQ